MVTEEIKIGIARWLLDPDRKKHSPIPLVTLERKIKSAGLDYVYRTIELPLVPVLGAMHDIGIKVDRAYLQKLAKELGLEIQSIERGIYKSVGRTFNLNSPKQLSEILFQILKLKVSGVRKTKTGLLSTDEDTLKLLSSEHAAVEAILRYRELFKLKSTYVDPLRELADKNSRVHTTFLQTGAATGRLSSRNPNMQNIPATGEWAKKIRQAFIAETDFVFLSFDYSQIELRVVATIANDKKMLQAFRDGKDIHAITAAYIYGVAPETITKEMRRTAKTLNFGVSYGMGANAFAKVSGLSVKEAREFIKKYFETFSSVREWQKKTIAFAHKYGYVETLTGRKRFLRFINSPFSYLRSEAERAAINAPNQGLEADIMKMAMIRVNELIEQKKWSTDCRMLLTIHDELVLEVKPWLLHTAIPVFRKELENIYKLAVPLTVACYTGKNWGEMKPREE